MTETMPYVRDVNAQIKNPLRAEFGPKTLILGDNGSGKSTLTMALELALAGRATDVAGNPDETRDERLRQHLAPAGTDTAAATVTLSDGRVFGWEKAAKETAKATLLGAEVFPVAQLTGLTARPNDQIRAWLASAVERTASPHMLNQAWEEVSPAARNKILDALNMDVPDDPKADPFRDLVKRADFGAILESLDKEVKAAQRARRDAEGALSTLGATGTPDPDARAALDVRIAAAQERAGAQSHGISEADRANAASFREIAVREQAEADANVRTAQANVDGWTAEIARLAQEGQATAKRRAAFQGLRDFVTNANPNAETCVVCGTHQPATVGPLYANLLPEIEALLADASLADPTVNARQQAEAWKTTLDAAQRAHAQATSDIARLDTVLSQPVAQDNSEAHAEVARLISERDAMIRSEGVAERAAAARAKRDQAEQDETDAKAAVKAVKRARESFIAAGRSNLADLVTRFLPEGVKFAVEEEGVHVLIGLRNDPDGELRTALSGSEEVVMLTAIACALAQGSKDPAIVIVPDRQWDPKHLVAAMRAVQDADAQVVMVSTVSPHGRYSKKNWTTIDLSTGDGLRDVNGDGPVDPPVSEPDDAPAVAEPATTEAAPAPFPVTAEAK